MIQTVIFDLDGVIIDSEPIYFAIENAMFDELNISVSFGEHCGYVGTSSQNMWEAIVEKYKLTCKAETLVKQQSDAYLNHLTNQTNLRPIDGVAELISDFQKANFKMLLASSSHMTVIDIVIDKFHLSEFFIGKISGTDLKFSKPHPEIFLKAAKLADCDPKQCAVIEDSANGVTAAKAAGMKCIGFANPNSGAQDLTAADLIITCFNQLNVDIVKNL